MFQTKMALVLVAALSCIFAASCLDAVDVVVGQTVKPNEAEVKINWSPVWDDNEGHNEFVQREFEGDNEQDNQQNCSAPNGQGLQNLFNEVEKLLPKQQIKAIAKTYSEDPEIKALKAFITNPKTIEMVKAIRNSPEYQILKDYSCKTLHIDIQKYNKLARIVLEPLLTRTNDGESGKGIRGFINEINAVIPRQQLRRLYENLLASDEELNKAVAKLKSKEFHQLLANVKRNNPEYEMLREQLNALGLPLEGVHKVLVNALEPASELGLLV